MSNKRPYANGNTTVQLPLTPELVGEIETALLDPTAVEAWVDVALGEGYSLTLSYDAEREHFTCQMRGQYRDMTNAGLSFYANAQTWYAALVVALVKHFLGAGGKAWNEKSSGGLPKYS